MARIARGKAAARREAGSAAFYFVGSLARKSAKVVADVTPIDITGGIVCARGRFGLVLSGSPGIGAAAFFLRSAVKVFSICQPMIFPRAVGVDGPIP
jgi:hypothetical protein